MRAFPKVHTGIQYTLALAELAKKRAVSRYFEIGVLAGRNLSHIPCDHAIGVDPFLQLTHNVAASKQRVSLFQMTSDRYFADVDSIGEFGAPADLCFLDGMHLFEYLLRDFFNAEAICSKNSLIAMHDCLPLNDIMVGRDHQQVLIDAKGKEYERYWTGDVWKVIQILKKYRPDLSVLLLDCPPTGLVLVTNLDPGSTVLQENYIDIVSEFAAVPNDKKNILKMYSDNEIRRSAEILNEFDQSLYLKA